VKNKFLGYKKLVEGKRAPNQNKLNNKNDILIKLIFALNPEGTPREIFSRKRKLIKNFEIHISRLSF
jgi:hypothetical protein